MNLPMVSPAESVARDFAARFGGEARLFRAPARVNLIGEYTDFNEGLVLPAAVALYTSLAISPRPRRQVRVYSSNFDELAAIDLDHPRPAAAGHWSNYVAAVVASLREQHAELVGADLLLQGDIPLGGGLSSSASLEVCLALALLKIAGIGIEGKQLALLCQRAEAEFVGVRCGIMDQYSIACAEPGSAMLLDCRSITHRNVALPQGLRILLIHSGVQRQLQDGAFNVRRQECAQGLQILQRHCPGVRALRDVSSQQIEASAALLGATLYRRCRHVVSEIRRVRRAHDAMRAGAIDALGALITASHTSLREDFEVSCPELDQLVAMANRCPGVLGARMVGAGFGGCILVLLRAAGHERAIRELLDGSTTVLGKSPWHYLIESAGAASEVQFETRAPRADQR
jgi:galactokinase